MGLILILFNKTNYYIRRVGSYLLYFFFFYQKGRIVFLK